MNESELYNDKGGFTESPDYSNCTITDIRRGKGAQSNFIYATLRDGNGKVLIGATLDYIVKKLGERLPGKSEENNDLSVL